MEGVKNFESQALKDWRQALEQNLGESSAEWRINSADWFNPVQLSETDVFGVDLKK